MRKFILFDDPVHVAHREYQLRWRNEHLEESRARGRSVHERNRRSGRTARTRAVRQAFADSLRVGGCVDCGIKNLSVLQSDHVRGVKFKGIGYLAKFSSFEAIEQEMIKCDVRCANCHQIKSVLAQRQGRG